MTVTLRPTVLADLDVLYEHQADPVSAELAGFPSRDRPSYWAHQSVVLADPSSVLSTIEADGEVVGSAVCFGPPTAREVGYWVGREHWGRGIATEALRQLVDQVPDRPLRGCVVPANVASQHVLLANGFVQDGVDGEHLVFVLH